MREVRRPGLPDSADPPRFPRCSLTLPGDAALKPVLPTLALLMLATLPPLAMAQAAPTAPAAQVAPVAPTADAQLPTVTTDVKRGEFSSMSYRMINEVLYQLRTTGEGLFVARFKLTPGKEGQPLRPDAKLALMSDEHYINIPVDAEGNFDLPSFPPKQARDMELSSNLPKGSTGLKLDIDIATPPEQLTLGTVRRIVNLGQRLRSEILPWYVRWLFPNIEGVIACSDQPQWALDWPEGGQVLTMALSADKAQREPYTPKDKPSRACTVMTGQENWPDSAKLQPPAGGNTKLYVKLRVKQAR